VIDAATIETPIGVVDLARARANAVRVVAYADEHGLGWRPHIKTHKSRTIARMQLDAGARGLTVATLHEAEVMADLTDDLLLAYPPVGEAKLHRLLRLPAGLDLKVALDSLEVLEPLAGAAHAAGRSVGVLVEQDVGMGRVGVQGADQVVALALAASRLEGVAFRGVLFYPGHIRMEEEAQGDPISVVAGRVGETLDALAAADLEPGIVSGGSTPTLWRSHEMPGLTEIRSGSCIYFDREGVDVGVAGFDDLAYTVLATVVSTAVPGHAVVDAGSKALAKESRGRGGGFGVLLDRPEVTVSGLSEEHGVLDLFGTEWRPRIGERVRIVPNHVCVSVNLQDHLLAVDGGAHSILELEGRGRTASHQEKS
jgi:D-serine deaminase-like pyridoxal phosphate-dependent protein